MMDFWGSKRYIAAFSGKWKKLLDESYDLSLPMIATYCDIIMWYAALSRIVNNDLDHGKQNGTIQQVTRGNHVFDQMCQTGNISSNW